MNESYRLPPALQVQVGRTSEGAAHLRYPAYKASGVPWLGDVPAHWDVLPGRACYREKKVPNTGLKETTVLSLSYGQIVVKPPEKLHGLVPASFETYQIVDPGDIIIRPTDLQNDWNSLRFGLSRHRGIITSAYMCFHTQDALTREYGHLLLHTYDLMKIFYGLGSGLRQNLDWTDFKYLPCLAPPPAEQRAIAAFLDHHDRLTRRYIHAQQRLIKLLTEQKQALIQQAVTRGLDPDVPLKDSGIPWLGKIPAHWIVQTLKRTATLHRGYDLTDQQREPGPYPVVSSGGIIGTHSQAMSEGPGVVTGRYGSTGKVYFIESDFWPHNTSLYVSDFNRNFPRFTFYLLQVISINAHSGKSAVPGVDRKDLHEIRVPVPDPEEQMSIVAMLDTRLQTIDIAIARAQHQIALIREYRTRLIADVVTGKLDVRGFQVGRTSEGASHLDEDAWADLEDEETDDVLDDLDVEAGTD